MKRIVTRPFCTLLLVAASVASAGTMRQATAQIERPSIESIDAAPADPTADNIEAIRRALVKLDTLAYTADFKDERVLAERDTALELVSLADRQLSALDQPPAADAALRDKSEQQRKQQQVREQRCHVAFLKGEVQRRVALAMSNANPKREQMLIGARETFRAMRVDFRALSAAQLGYIGEARVNRAMGDLKNADAVIEQWLAFDRRATPQRTQMSRLAYLEHLENVLASDDPQAGRKCREARQSPLFADATDWHGRLRWLEARALAKLAGVKTNDDALQVVTAQQTAAIVALLRDESVIAAAPHYARFQLLAAIDRAASGKVMTATERLQWAGDLIALGHKMQAADCFEQALRDDAAAIGMDELLDYGSVLWHLGWYERAAAIYQSALDKLPADDARRSRVVQWQATCVQRAAGITAGGEANRAEMDAYWNVAVSNSAFDTRQAALRQWYHLCRQLDPASCYEKLRACESLIGDDLYLHHALASLDRAAVMRTWNAGEMTKDEAVEAIETIDAKLSAAISAAEGNDAETLLPYAHLLRARMLAAEPIDAPRRAMQLLETHWSAVEKRKELRPAATELRVSLMVRLGMIDRAARLLAGAEQSGTMNPALMLRLAEALAEEYDGADADRRKTLREQVGPMIEKALAGSANGSESYDALVLDAADVFNRVESFLDAERILRPLIASAENERIDEELALVFARALLGQAKHDEALTVLNGFKARPAASYELWVVLGEAERRLERYENAVAALRKARKSCRAGSDDWWSATLELIELYESTGEKAAAVEILRVARAIYPKPRSASMQQRTDRAAKRLSTD